MLKWFSFIALLAVCEASALPEEELVTFDWDGIEHQEWRQVQGDIVTLRNEGDGFTVILDYERDIMVIKNVTSQMCFFASLEGIPVAKDGKVPFMVQTVTNETTKAETGGESVVPFVFSVVGPIPANYIMLTNDDTVVGECVYGTSFWVETKSTTKRAAGMFVLGIIQIILQAIGIAVQIG